MPLQLSALDKSVPVKPTTLEGERALVIGRSSCADIRINHPTVSRRHALIEPLADGLWLLTDQDSENGTYLHGSRIRETILKPGQVIRLGEVCLKTIESLPDDGMTDGRDLTTDQTITQTVLDDAHVVTWSSIPAVPLENTHLEALLDSWADFASYTSERDRMSALLRRVTDDRFGGWHACVVQLDGQEQGPESAVLLSQEASHGGVPVGFIPYLSRRVLDEATRTHDVVCASNDPGGLDPGSSKTPITVTQAAKTPRDVVCVPWIGLGEKRQALYLTLPPTHATPGWITFFRLIVRQMQEVTRAQSLAGRAAELQRVEAELRKAATIQAANQAKDIKCGGIEVVVSYQPSFHVGGDLTINEVMPDGRLAVVVGDVTGHGLDAALLGSAVHATLLSSLMAGASIAHSTELVHRLMMQGDYDSRFVTATLLAIDPESLEVEYVNAGHPPILEIGEGGVETWPRGEFFPLGTLDEKIEAKRRTISAGNTLCLYSDGLIEIRHKNGQLIGEQRVGAVFQDAIKNHPNDLQAVKDEVQQTLSEVRATPTRADDETLLLIGCRQPVQ